MTELRYSTAGMAHVEAERLTQATGVKYYMKFSPRYSGDFQPFTIEAETRA